MQMCKCSKQVRKSGVCGGVQAALQQCKWSEQLCGSAEGASSVQQRRANVPCLLVKVPSLPLTARTCRWAGVSASASRSAATEGLLLYSAGGRVGPTQSGPLRSHARDPPPAGGGLVGAWCPPASGTVMPETAHAPCQLGHSARQGLPRSLYGSCRPEHPPCV